MAWTLPKTWATGDVLTAADINAQVAANADYIANTALKKPNANSAAYSSTTTIAGAEATITTLALADPAFPGNYGYVPWGTFVAFYLSANDAYDLFFRDNAIGGTITGRWKLTASGINRRGSLGGVGGLTSGITGARTVYYRLSTTGGGGSGAQVNSGGITTYVGAFVAPI